jgi:hypothetical protein
MNFFQKHAWPICSQVITVVVAIIGFAWVGGIQVERMSGALSNLGDRVGKVERTLESMRTLDLRVTQLEQGQMKMGDMVARLEKAVVRLEALSE